MEFTLKTLMVAILILIIVAILVAIVTGWGSGAKGLIDNFVKWIGSLTGGEQTTTMLPQVQMPK